MNFQSYQISRTELDDGVGLLIGNGEMGGLVRNDGLGFDEIWFTDFWKCESERASIGPFRLEQVNSERGNYRQELALEEAVVTTASDEGDEAYCSEWLFSQTRRHALIGMVENRSRVAQEWELSLPSSSLEIIDDSTLTLPFPRFRC